MRGKEFDRAVRAYGDSVYRVALHALKNQADAEDVMHDCYIRVYYASQEYRRMGNPMSWILTIAKNINKAAIQMNAF